MSNKSSSCHIQQQTLQQRKGKANTELPDSTIDYEKIAKIRQQLANGTLRINTRRLAEKMLATEKTLFPEEY